MPMRSWHLRRGFFLWRAAGFFLFMVLAGGAACVGTLWMLGLLVVEAPEELPLAPST